MKEVGSGEAWDKKKILISLVVLSVLATVGYGLRTGISSKNNFQILNKDKRSHSPSVKGTATQANDAQSSQNESFPNLKTAVAQELESLKQEANNVNISEIATSSPQIQKIINDVKSLQGYPQSQAKNICLKICGGL